MRMTPSQPRNRLAVTTLATPSASAAIWLAALVVLAVLSLALPRPTLGAAEAVDLTGSWEMDKELSEDPMQKMREQRGGGLRGGRGGWGGGVGGGRRGGMGGGGGRGGGGPSGSGSQVPGQSREEMRQRMEELRASLDRLEIGQTASEVRITYADSREQVLETDNKKAPIDTPFGEGTIRAKWRDDGGLVVKTRTERRKTTETYYVTNDGQMMTVLVEMEGDGPMGNVSFKRIYRPAAPAADTDPEASAEPAAS